MRSCVRNNVRTILGTILGTIVQQKVKNASQRTGNNCIRCPTGWSRGIMWEQFRAALKPLNTNLWWSEGLQEALNRIPTIPSNASLSDSFQSDCWCWKGAPAQKISTNVSFLFCFVGFLFIFLLVFFYFFNVGRSKNGHHFCFVHYPPRMYRLNITRSVYKKKLSVYGKCNYNRKLS